MEVVIFGRYDPKFVLLDDTLSRSHVYKITVEFFSNGLLVSDFFIVNI